MSSRARQNARISIPEDALDCDDDNEQEEEKLEVTAAEDTESSSKKVYETGVLEPIAVASATPLATTSSNAMDMEMEREERQDLRRIAKEMDEQDRQAKKRATRKGTLDQVQSHSAVAVPAFKAPSPSASNSASLQKPFPTEKFGHTTATATPTTTGTKTTAEPQRTGAPSPSPSLRTPFPTEKFEHTQTHPPNMPTVVDEENQIPGAFPDSTPLHAASSQQQQQQQSTTTSQTQTQPQSRSQQPLIEAILVSDQQPSSTTDHQELTSAQQPKVDAVAARRLDMRDLFCDPDLRMYTYGLLACFLVVIIVVIVVATQVAGGGGSGESGDSISSISEPPQEDMPSVVPVPSPTVETSMVIPTDSPVLTITPTAEDTSLATFPPAIFTVNPTERPITSQPTPSPTSQPTPSPTSRLTMTPLPESFAPTLYTTAFDSMGGTDMGPGPSGGQNTIVDIAVATPVFGTLVELLTAANLVDDLSGEGPFTLFAPTNNGKQMMLTYNVCGCSSCCNF